MTTINVVLNPEIALERPLLNAINEAIADHLIEDHLPEDQQLTSVAWHISADYTMEYENA